MNNFIRFRQMLTEAEEPEISDDEVEPKLAPTIGDIDEKNIIKLKDAIKNMIADISSNLFKPDGPKIIEAGFPEDLQKIMDLLDSNKRESMEEAKKLLKAIFLKTTRISNAEHFKKPKFRIGMMKLKGMVQRLLGPLTLVKVPPKDKWNR